MANLAFLQKAYLAYFGRPVDTTGTIAFQNTSEAAVQAAFAASPESQALYGATFGVTQVNAIYQTLFGRAAEPAGLAYWVNQVAIGALTPAGAAVAILNGSLNADAIAIANKLVASAAFTAGLNTTPLIIGYTGDAAAASARAFLATVTATPAAQSAIDAAVIAAVAVGATGTVGSTFTLTTGVDNILGTSGNDTFNAIVDNFGAAATTTAGVRTTLSLGDIIDGGAGTDTAVITSNLTGGSTIPVATWKSVEIINIANVAPLAADVVTMAASSAPQATQFNSIGSGSLTVTGIGSAAIGTSGVAAQIAANVTTITAVGANTINIQNTTTAATATGTIKFDVSGGAATSAQAVVINTLAGSANVVNDIKIGNGTVGATSLTINAATNLKTTTITEFVANTLKTVVIAGAATTVDLGTVPSSALASVDASGLTAGGAKVTIGTNLATTFVGGAGNDTVTIVGGAAMTGAVNAGAGVNTLSISDAGALAATSADTSLVTATASKFTNFQTLQVANTGAVGSAVTFDASLLASVTTLNVGASAGSVTVNNLAANAVVNLVGTAGGTNATGGTAFTFKVPSATSTDTLTFNINNGNTATSGNVNGLSDTLLTLGTSVSTLNIGSNGSILGTGTQNTITALNALDTGLNKIVITGSQPLSLTTGALTKSLTIDGSAATGSLTIDASAMVTTTAGTNINGGSANDTITSNKTFIGTETIYGGAGGDTITIGTHATTTNVVSLIYKAGTDSVLDATGVTGASGTATANTGKMDVITGFITTEDKIDLTAFNTATAQKGIADKGAFVSLAAGIAAATANATFFNDASNTQRVAVEFHVGSDTYVVVDVDHNGTFNVATDLGIKLAGVAAIVAADILA